MKQLKIEANVTLTMNGTEDLPDIPGYGCKVNTIQMSTKGSIKLAYKGQPIECGQTIGYGTGIISC